MLNFYLSRLFPYYSLNPLNSHYYHLNLLHYSHPNLLHYSNLNLPTYATLLSFHRHSSLAQDTRCVCESHPFHRLQLQYRPQPHDADAVLDAGSCRIDRLASSYS